MRSRMCASWLLLSVALVPVGLGDSARAGEDELAAGKVKLVGAYERKKLKEGTRQKTYFVLPPGEELKLRAGGPVSFVLLARRVRAARVSFGLALDDDSTATAGLKLLRRVSRGMHLQVPEGTHEVRVRASARVLVRPMKVRRGPVRGEHPVAWIRAGPEDDALALTPLVPPEHVDAAESKEVVTSVPPPLGGSPSEKNDAQSDSGTVSAPIVEKQEDPPQDKTEGAAVVPGAADLERAKTRAVADAAEVDVADKPVEVRLRVLADRLAAGFASLPGAGRYQRLVVAKFSESGEATRDIELGTLVSAQLATFLRRDHGFFLLERERLSDVLKEVELAMTGLLDPAKAARVGKMVGAQAVIVGNVAVAGADFVINARAISVERANVLVAESMHVPRAGMVALSEESVVLRTRSGAVFRSLVAPGWGQFYNRQPVKGGIIIGAEVALVGAAVAMHLLGAADEDAYRASDFAQQHAGLTPVELGQKAAALHDSAEDYYGWRNILIYGAVGVWLYNVLDAYLFGIDGEEQTGMQVVPLGAAGGGGVGIGGSF